MALSMKDVVTFLKLERVMGSEKLKDLRHAMMDEMEKHMSDSLSYHGGRDLTQTIIDLSFGGCKGIENESDEELLALYRDEMYESYEENEDGTYEDMSDKAIKLRDLADQYELELIAEKELLGEEV